MNSRSIKISFLKSLVLTMGLGCAVASYAGTTDLNLTKLAEHDFVSFSRFCSEKVETFFFNKQRYVQERKIDGSNLIVTTRKFSPDFKTFETFTSTFDLGRDGTNFKFMAEIEANDSVAYFSFALRRGEIGSESFENYIYDFKTTDGINWEPVTSDIDVVHANNDVLLGQDSSNDKFYSNDLGSTWQKLEYNGSIAHMSGYESNIYFNEFEGYDHKAYTMLDTSTMQFKAVNFPKMKITENNVEHDLNLSYLSIFKAGDFLVADTYFHLFEKNSSGELESFSEYGHMVSKDGLNWQLIDLKFPNSQDLQFVGKSGDFYYAATTAKSDDGLSTCGSDSDDDNTIGESENNTKNDLKTAKVHFYKMTEEQFLNGSKADLIPVHTLENTELRNSLQDQQNYPDLMQLAYLVDDKVKVGVFKLG